MSLVARSFTIVFLSTAALCQLPSSRCNDLNAPLVQCPHSVSVDARSGVTSDPTSEKFFPATQPKHKGFRWGRALFESFMFLSIEQAYTVHMDYHWVTVENGVPFNHYWQDYTHSLSTWAHSGWNDGDPALYNYVGHPIQGALTSFIQIQNDPQGETLEFSNTREYWWSRFKATMWNAAYSTQWSIGPLSEVTVEKYGTEVRSPWNEDGSWPCTHRGHCLTGVGQVNLVITPVGGFGWMLGEDLLDRYVARRVERSTRNSFLVGFTRCALNPIRGGANILHGKPPWYRASRNAREVYMANEVKKRARAEKSIPQ